jgi:hypothetical protein
MVAVASVALAAAVAPVVVLVASICWLSAYRFEDGSNRVSERHLQSAAMWLSFVDWMLMPASLNAVETDWSRPWQARDRAASPGRW